ncbi:hypothetical protein NPIL_672971 [Nephila pilipes]|uniref:Uncharacterized protein n=1 Tax=Nephila pilipes TaxID=299642 RepID=A0A8X6U5E5_NEPPI|nr:hypothetical protein NPIL_672971 [Nephila pilipes]
MPNIGGALGEDGRPINEGNISEPAMNPVRSPRHQPGYPSEGGHPTIDDLMVELNPQAHSPGPSRAMKRCETTSIEGTLSRCKRWRSSEKAYYDRRANLRYCCELAGLWS